MSSPDSMLSFETDDSPESTVESGLAELERHRYASALAQIEIASCFRNEKEPLSVVRHIESGDLRPSELDQDRISHRTLTGWRRSSDSIYRTTALFHYENRMQFRFAQERSHTADDVQVQPIHFRLWTLESRQFLTRALNRENS